LYFVSSSQRTTGQFCFSFTIQLKICKFFYIEKLTKLFS
jgi:hypothetical protein